MRNSARRGMSLVDTAMALAVTGVALSGMVQLQNNSNYQVKDATTAQVLAEIGQAAAQYIQANQSALVADLQGGGVGEISIGRLCPTCTAPTAGAGVTPDLKSLQAAGFLPLSFVDIDGWKQHHALLVKYIAPSPKYPTGGVDAVIVSYSPGAVAGSPPPIKDGDLGAIAGKLGAQGGFFAEKPTGGVPTNSWGGAYGSWARHVGDFSLSDGGTLPDGTTVFARGSEAYTLAFSNVVPTDYLYRDYNGNSAYNTMNTDLYMNGGGQRNNIQGAANTDTQTISNSDGTGAVTITATTTYAQNVKLAGNSALAWQTWGGGWYMSDSKYIRALANKAVLASSYADSADPTYQLTPSGTSNLNAVNLQTMTASGAVSAQTLTATQAAYSPQFCGDAACNYYLTPDGTSNLNAVNGQSIKVGTPSSGGGGYDVETVPNNVAAHGPIGTDAYMVVGSPTIGSSPSNIIGEPGSIAASGAIATGTNLYVDGAAAVRGAITAVGGIASLYSSTVGGVSGAIFADGGIVSGANGHTGGVWSNGGFVATTQSSSFSSSNPIGGLTKFAYLNPNGQIQSTSDIVAGENVKIGQNQDMSIVDTQACSGDYGSLAFSGGVLFVCDGSQWHRVCTASGPGGDTSHTCGAY